MHPPFPERKPPKIRQGPMMGRCNSGPVMTSLRAAPRLTCMTQLHSECYTYYLLGNVAAEVRVHCVRIQVCLLKHKWAYGNQPRHEETLLLTSHCCERLYSCRGLPSVLQGRADVMLRCDFAELSTSRRGRGDLVDFRSFPLLQCGAVQIVNNLEGYTLR